MKRAIVSLLFGCVCCGVLAQSVNNYSIRLLPGVTIPLGETRDHYGVGASADLSLLYALSSAPFLRPSLDVGYSISRNSITDSNLSVISGAGGAELAVSPLERVTLRAGGSAGYGVALYDQESGGSFYFQTGLGASFHLSPSVELGVDGKYRHLTSTPSPLFQGVSLAVQFSFSPSGSSRPQMDFDGVEFDRVFPVFYTYYDEHPLGSIRLVNGERGRIEDVKVSFVVPQYMDSERLCATFESMRPGETKDVPIYALFNDGVLSITEGDTAAATVRVEYTYQDQDRVAQVSEPIQLLHRNAMTWDDDRKAASFVTARDPVVLQFSRNAASDVRSDAVPAVSNSFRLGMGLFQTLSEHGMSYVIDPQTPYIELSENEFAIDYLQFPGQSLAYRAGDCDDLSILYAALLEAVGVETAFITIPGHIYMAFALGMPPDEARRTFYNSEDLIFRDGESWVPVEVTVVDAGFLEAWRQGAKQWRAHEATGDARFFPIHEAWELYEPVGGSDIRESVAYPGSSAVLASYREELDTFIQREIAEEAQRIEERIRATDGRPTYVNRLGVLYARFGLFDEAEGYLRRAADAGYAPAMTNMGNLFFLQGEYSAALRQYERATLQSPDEVPALLGLARCHYQLGAFDQARQYHGRLRERSPEVARRYAYLGGSTAGSDRASDAATREGAIWVE